MASYRHDGAEALLRLAPRGSTDNRLALTRQRVTSELMDGLYVHTPTEQLSGKRPTQGRGPGHTLCDAQGGCEVGAVWGRPAVAVAAGCSRLQAAATLLMQDGVISGV